MDSILIVTVFFIVALYFKKTLKDDNYDKILQYVMKNDMIIYKNVDCTYRTGLIFENKIFDIYYNDDYIILLNDSKNKIIQHRYFSENYLVQLNENDIKNFYLTNLFINNIKISDFIINDKILNIMGKLYSKSIFGKHFNYINQISIEANFLF